MAKKPLKRTSEIVKYNTLHNDVKADVKNLRVSSEFTKVLGNTIEQKAKNITEDTFKTVKSDKRNKITKLDVLKSLNTNI